MSADSGELFIGTKKSVFIYECLFLQVLNFSSGLLISHFDYAFANKNIQKFMDDLNECIDNHIITYHQWPLNTNQMLVFTISSIKGQFRQICEAFKHEVKNWHLVLIVCSVCLKCSRAGPLKSKRIPFNWCSLKPNNL